MKELWLKKAELLHLISSDIPSLKARNHFNWVKSVGKRNMERGDVSSGEISFTTIPKSVFPFPEIRFSSMKAVTIFLLHSQI